MLPCDLDTCLPCALQASTPSKQSCLQGAGLQGSSLQAYSRLLLELDEVVAHEIDASLQVWAGQLCSLGKEVTGPQVTHASAAVGSSSLQSSRM